MTASDISQLVSVPTHDKDNILDPMVTNIIGVALPKVEASFSDHRETEFSIPTSFKIDRSESFSPNNIPYWMLIKADLNSINHESFQL